MGERMDMDVVVIGAGHAGLAVSWHLKRRGIEHAVLEQGRVGESWRSQRWDSFALNTPVWASRLPGAADPDEPLDSFLSRDAWVEYLAHYAATFALPVHEGVRVESLERSSDRAWFVLRTAAPESQTIRARAVVLASGFQRVPKMPPQASNVPESVTSLHTSAYRRPDRLPPGAVLVVGSAQSGGQVAEDLLDAGRTVYLAASSVGRMQRRYRGRDIFEWLVPAGFFDQTVDQLPDPRMQFAAQPIISGVGRLGHTLSLQWLASRGAILLGRLVAIEGTRARFDPDLAVSIRNADRVSAEIRALIERGIQAGSLDAHDPEPDPADEPVADPEGIATATELDLEAAGITSVVWSTGFSGDLSWVDLEIKDTAGAPIHERGRAPVPGVWFLGIPWMRSRKSGILLGADEDGSAAAAEIADYLGR
jgi:putative flavoprotein involved in K+ transport